MSEAAEAAYTAWGGKEPFFALPPADRERWSRVAEAVEDSSDALRMETVIQKVVEEAMPDGYDIARQIRTAMDREKRAPKP